MFFFQLIKMKNIRNNVFETNSSSSHSIVISRSNKCKDTIELNNDGCIVLTGGEFGWDWEMYHFAEDKANYCAIDC